MCCDVYERGTVNKPADTENANNRWKVVVNEDGTSETIPLDWPDVEPW